MTNETEKTSFKLGGAREMLTKEKATDLVAPLESNVSKVQSIQLSGKSFGLDAAKVFAPVFEKLTNNLKSVDLSDIIAGKYMFYPFFDVITIESETNVIL